VKPVYGHDSTRRAILDAARSGRLHHAWILSGPQGIGKASLARELALLLLAGEEETGQVAESHPAARLFAAGTHPDYAELRRLEKDSGDLARNIGVDQVRALGRLLGTAPSVSQRRVILIDAADDMERGAANALLKCLEEPPHDVVFLLVSHAPSRLLPTIRSRCRLLRLSALNDTDMANALRGADAGLHEGDVAELTGIGGGSPGRALALSGLGVSDMLAALERIVDDGDQINAERLALAKTLSGKATRPRFEAFLDLVPDFIAERTRTKRGGELEAAIGHWEQARDLAAQAIPLSLDPAATVFELCGHVAAIRDRREPGMFG
jgi:DNA polymerase-3 subunit delta'